MRSTPASSPGPGVDAGGPSTAPNVVELDEFRSPPEQLPCTGLSSVFFATDRSSIAHAKRICAACPLQERCLQRALDRAEPFGVWGGADEKERKAMSREAVA